LSSNNFQTATHVKKVVTALNTIRTKYQKKYSVVGFKCVPIRFSFA